MTTCVFSGRYSVYIETVSKADGEKFQNRRGFEDEFIVLFNPWCKGIDTILLFSVLVCKFSMYVSFDNVQCSSLCELLAYITSSIDSLKYE